VIEDHSENEPGRRRESRSIRLASLTRRVPGAAANAPKRNVLVGCVYLFTCLLAGGLLWTAL
jgi:hypothetical protein